MEILGIDPDNTDERQIAFVTQPPLTEEVFKLYGQMYGPGNYFRRKEGLLVTERSDMSKEYLDETAKVLTQIEQQIENRRLRAQQDRDARLQRVSEQTGMPILPSAVVPNSASTV
jgi:tRNA uridine 5-carbamoylmethylation protein Kti12